jgi:hypothetical protein
MREIRRPLRRLDCLVCRIASLQEQANSADIPLVHASSLGTLLVVVFIAVDLPAVAPIGQDYRCVPGLPIYHRRVSDGPGGGARCEWGFAAYRGMLSLWTVTGRRQAASDCWMRKLMIENDFDVPFVAALALRVKQIQQTNRPVIAVHKWFARRPGALFRGLILAEFGNGPVSEAYYKPVGELAIGGAGAQTVEHAGRDHHQGAPRPRDLGGALRLRAPALRGGGAHDRPRPTARWPLVHRGPCRQV